MILRPAALTAALALLAFLPAAHAGASLQEWTIDISLNEDRTSDWRVAYLYNESVGKSDFFLLAGVSGFNVTADSMPAVCTISRTIASSIVCENINAKSVVYNIRTFPIVTSLQGLNIFSHRFSVTQPTSKFGVTIKLPIGTALAESSKLEGTGLNPFEPPGGRQGTDGRRIFVEWLFDRPKLGETAIYTVVYEQVKPVDFAVFIVIAGALIIAFIAFVMFLLRRSRVEEILPVLTENERRVMEIVLREKQVDQRQIVKETDFSKAKASRIIQDLEKRGLVEKRRKGRQNIILLRKTRNLGEISENK